MRHKWPLVRLGEVLKERREEPASEDLAVGRIKIVEKIAFDTGRIQLRVNGDTKTGMILIRPGDLVVSGINAAKGAIAVYGDSKTDPVASTIHYGAYIPDRERVCVHYLWWLLRSRFFRELLLEYLPGGIKTELKAKRLMAIPAPLPPVAEQRRLVARIEELASQVHEARAFRQWAAEEAEALMGRGIVALLDQTGWETQPLGQLLTEPPRNGLSPKPEVETGGRPMLRINAVSSSLTRFVDLTAVKQVEVSDGEAEPFILQHDDVFIVRYNGDINRVAKPAIYKADGECRAVFPDKLMRLRPDQTKMLPDFLVFALNARSVREQVEGLGKTTAGNIGISGGNAKAFVVPVPPLREQRSIVSELDTLQAEVDTLGRLQADTATELEALLHAFLDRAFKGELN